MAAALQLASVLGTSCGGGSSSSAGEYPPPDDFTSTELEHGEALPGVNVTLESVSGATGPGGSFRPGDHLSVTYSLTQDDGAPWDILEMPSALAFVSGPTFNYQRVIGQQADVAARSVRLGPGRFRYTCSAPLPGHYMAPLNDSESIGAVDGELQGQPLLDGTYSVALSFAWSFTIEGSPRIDAGEAVRDFLVGDSAVLVEREVVTQANCNRCHVDLSAHAGRHTQVRACVLCHTSGAEDAIAPDVAGGTPGVSVDSRVLFHKIHNGSHLPSVIGIVATSTGVLDYAAPPVPYRVVGAGGEVHDYSSVAVALGPNKWLPTPEDFGYSALSDAEKERDEATRTGLTNCNVCHGDPDGDGPLVSPTQGDLIYAEPQRRSCGACHDDVRWDRPYVRNQQTMDPQPNDSGCNKCHNALGGVTATIDGHRHPLLDTIDQPHAPFEFAWNTGLHVTLDDVDEWGTHDGDGTIDLGEGILLHFALTDDAGNDVIASLLARVSVNVRGPDENSQLVQEIDLPLSGVFAGGHLALPIPERLRHEIVGYSTDVLGDVFMIPRAPLFALPGSEPVVFVHTGRGSESETTADASAGSNFLQIVDPVAFERDVYVLIDGGTSGLEEYLRVQYVEGRRIWFSSPASPAYAAALKHDHKAGARVQTVALDVRTAGVDYTIDTSTGALTELTEFGDGAAVVVDATVAWRLPATYPLPMNASDTLGESAGKWVGKPIVSGTYRVTMQGRLDKTFFVPGEEHVYPIVSTPSGVEVGILDGEAGRPGKHGHDEDEQAESSCQSCHVDVWYHAGHERGLERCLACHANAGIEDRPKYVSGKAPSTPGVSADFRSLLHTIHMGTRYDAASPFEIVGQSVAAYPNDFQVRSFESVVFPVMPGGVAQCDKCHDDRLPDWREPRVRDHPTDPGSPVLAWRIACGSCHASQPARAHYAVNTDLIRGEACAVCHGIDAENEVARYHGAAAAAATQAHDGLVR